MTTNFKKIIDIANSLKDDTAAGGEHGYRAPNAIFFWLLWEFQENRAEGLEFEIETEDSSGRNYGQVYYDLLVIKVGESRLCCPLPLVRRDQLIAIMKIAKNVDRKFHDRKGCPLGRIERSELLAELAQLVSFRDLVWAKKEGSTFHKHESY